MSAKRIVLPLLLVGAFIAVAVIGTRLKQASVALTIACADPVQGCAFKHRGIPVLLRFSATPTPMQPFTMSVHTAGVQPVRAEFQMVGMDMGLNRYDLAAVAPGLFHAAITLPVCVSGQRDWKLYLEIGNQRYLIPFSSQ